MRTAEAGLLALQAVQVVFLLLHDWVPLGRLSNLAAVRASDSRTRLLADTLVSALPFALVFVACCAYGTSAWPGWLRTWLLASYAILFAGACVAWWIPYLLRPDPRRAQRYRVRFAGTVKFLPERNGISPDLLHVLFHACILATLVLLARL